MLLVASSLTQLKRLMEWLQRVLRRTQREVVSQPPAEKPPLTELRGRRCAGQNMPCRKLA
jgi:hypothetical protein